MSLNWVRRCAMVVAIVGPIATILVAGGASPAVASSPANPDTLTFYIHGVNFQTDQNLFIDDDGGDMTWGAYAPCQLTGVSVTLSNGVHESFGSTSTGTVAPLGIGVNAIVATGTNCTNTEGAIGIAALPSGAGYYIVESGGSNLSYGDVSYPSNAYETSDGNYELHLVAAAQQTVSNGSEGYVAVNPQGDVYTMGAAFYGSVATALNAPIVGIASTPDDLGYWLVAADGGVFAFGDAKFYGSMGSIRLNQPIVGMAADDVTGGYWLVAADGGVFSFNAPFYGSTGNIKLNKPIVGMEAAPNGTGYRFVASDGGVFSFKLPFEGSLGATAVSSPVVGMAAYGADGYWLVEHNNTVQPFGAAPTLPLRTIPYPDVRPVNAAAAFR
jgi:hypothetical protein